MIIGIGGVSRSGKTELAEALKNEFNRRRKSSIILSQDEFVFPSDQIPLIRDHIDWEVPDSINWQEFEKAILEATKTFDIVLVEGLMIYWNSAIDRNFDIRFFIEIPKDVFYQRKRIDLRWGEEPDWYIDYIWESYHKFGLIPDGIKMDFILDGTRDFDIKKMVRTMIPGRGGTRPLPMIE